MSATPPRAKIKYSREQQDSRLLGDGSRASRRGVRASPSWALAFRVGIVAGGVVGAILLIVSEFTTLYTVHASASSTPIAAIATHTHDSYALIPIALAVVTLAVGAGLFGSRLALFAAALLAVVTLGITLIGDLPDAQATGTVIVAGRYQSATASPGAGLYLETLGAILLVVVFGCGLLLAGAPWQASES